MSRSHRIALFIWPVTGRFVVGSLMMLMGLARGGILPSSVLPTVVPNPFYTWGLVLLGLALILTDRRRGLTWYGRLTACLATGLCAGLGFDIGPIGTSAYILYWLAFIAALNAGATHEC